MKVSPSPNIHRFTFRTLWLLGCFFLMWRVSLVRGAVLIVDPAPGASPYQTVQAGLNAAQPGDTVSVKAGVYRERVTFVRSGTAAQPIVLEGQPGAILDGSNPGTFTWVAAPEVGTGVYKVKITTFAPFTVTANNLWITMLDWRVCNLDYSGSSPISTSWQNILANAYSAHGWDGLRAVAMYDGNSADTANYQYLFVHLKDSSLADINPNTANITIAPKASAIGITNCNYCTVRGLTIRNATYGVSVANSVGAVVESCLVTTTDFSINLNPGADRCIVRYNEVALYPCFGANPWREASWDSWNANKKNGFYNRIAVYLFTSKGGHDVHDNYIHDHWDGVNSEGDSTHLLGNKVHHNHLNTLFDNTIKVSAKQKDNEYNDNIIEIGRVGLRLSNPGGDPDPNVDGGPIYIYRNIFVENKNDIRINERSTVPYMPLAEVWVYQNTSMSDTAVGVEWSTSKGAYTNSTSNYHFLNNLFWCITSTRDASYAKADWKSDYNVYVKANPGDRPFAAEWDLQSASWRTTQWNLGITQSAAATPPIETHSLWQGTGLPGFTNSSARDFSLTSGSVARARGIDLSTGQPRVLPGVPPGYFTGSAPDAGALQHGEAMPVLPRPMYEDAATGIVEAETLNYTATDSVMDVADASASAGVHTVLNANAVGDYVEFTAYVGYAAPYEVRIRGKKAPDRGIAKLMIDGVQFGSPWDQYAATSAWQEAVLGTANLSPGLHTFRLEVTDKNAVSTSYTISADTLNLTATIIMDNPAAGVTVTGAWTTATTPTGFAGSNYLHDQNAGKGTKSVRYTPALPFAANYEVYARWPAAADRANNVPIDIIGASGTSTVTVNQQVSGGTYVSLGIYSFNSTGGSVLIRTTGTTGYVGADAVKFIRR